MVIVEDRSLMCRILPNLQSKMPLPVFFLKGEPPANQSYILPGSGPASPVRSQRKFVVCAGLYNDHQFHCVCYVSIVNPCLDAKTI